MNEYIIKIFISAKLEQFRLAQGIVPTHSCPKNRTTDMTNHHSTSAVTDTTTSCHFLVKTLITLFIFVALGLQVTTIHLVVIVANTVVMIHLGALIGVLASVSAVVLWLYTFHRRFFISLYLTSPKVCAYGTYTSCGEALRTHFWFLIRGLFTTPDRDSLECQVKESFHQQYGADQEGRVLIAHSCRSIFYYIVRALLNQNKRVKKKNALRICLVSLQFGSFYRLLRGMEKATNCIIEFYEVDLKEKDWTLDEDTVDEDELKKCDLLLCQNLFGLPLAHDKLVQLAKKHDIPILEDCVQSGSLYSKYRGSSDADIVLYSGGLDKTPSCFGAGFGFFKDTDWGNILYDDCVAIHTILPLDTWQNRLVVCINTFIHLCIAQNVLGICNLIGLFAYVWVTERGDYINWYAISLKVRAAKSIAPFQHAECGFLRIPHPCQLQSTLYGLSKGAQYRDISQREVRQRELLLSTIPPQYHSSMFPWLTPEALELHRQNLGVSEFTWVVSPIGDRMHLCQFLNDQFIITLVNTTWETHEMSKLPVGKNINKNLIYLPNINQLDEAGVVKVGKALTLYCRQLEADGEMTFALPK
jgi:hypothetical protein